MVYRMEYANMITSVRQRLHSMNAEKIAEQKRLENSARNSVVYWRGNLYSDYLPEFDDVNDAEFYTEFPAEFYIGDSTDIFDADSDDIASYIAMFFPTFAYD
jgi:hypothetical protein